LGKNLATRLGIAPQLRLDDRDVAIRSHQQVVDRAVTGRHLSADAAKRQETRLDLGDREAFRIVEDQLLKKCFVERGIPRNERDASEPYG
jgi:hypothetical protein